jgi:hypothetical protein
MLTRRTIRIIGLRITQVLFVGILGFFVLFIWLNLPTRPGDQAARLGVTYSDRYAEALGLDPQQTLQAILGDLGVKQVRLPVYWDRIESMRGAYDFTSLDWQVDMAAQYHARVILVVGQRVPRWPECFIPEWAQQDTMLRQEALLDFIRTTVERYRERPEVVIWQVENEAFLDQRFGICPPLDVVFLDREIALVRTTDPTRPILMTDSGELSLWYQAAGRGDLFGTTLYRDLWHPLVGYVSYPIGPNFFLAKKWFIHLMVHQDRLMVIELQAEPWARGWVGDTPLPEQFVTMDEHKLRANIDYARRLGVSDIYLWGAEWWYWLKEVKHSPAVWDTARELFQS